MPKRLSVDMSGKIVDTIEDLSVITGLSKSDVVRMALLFLHEVKKNEQAGGYLAEFDSDGNKTKLLLLP